MADLAFHRRRAADRQREEHGVDALVPRLDFAALAQSVYLNQAALGLIPAQSLEVMLEHLTQRRSSAQSQGQRAQLSWYRLGNLQKVASHFRCKFGLM
jgi:hypothetical protein